MQKVLWDLVGGLEVLTPKISLLFKIVSLPEELRDPPIEEQPTHILGGSRWCPAATREPVRSAALL